MKARTLTSDAPNGSLAPVPKTWRGPYRAAGRAFRIARDRARQIGKQAAWSLRRRQVARAIEPVPPIPDRSILDGATLFFVPFAGVAPMLAQACVTGRALQERGHPVVFARCFRLFERCPTMDNDRLPYDASPEQRLECCMHCADNSLSMLAAYGLNAIDLRAFVTPDMIDRAARAIAGAPADLLAFQFEGLDFGKLTVMDFVLARKVSDFQHVSDSDRRVWLQYLHSGLLSYLLVDRLCREFGVARVIHVNDYGLLLSARTAARKNAVPCYGLTFPGHRNIDARRYMMLQNVWRPFSFKLRDSWPQCRNLCLDPPRVREVGEDLLVRLSGVGTHRFSPGKTTLDIRDRLGLSRKRRLVVAYTSSLDELDASRMGTDALGLAFADRPQPFSDQIEWLRSLTDYIDASEDLQLVVRIHPREGVNVRDSVISQHLQRLRDAFGGSYRNCHFVWPADPISSYDLGDAADLVLISWSSIGHEMARLGVPVLAAFNGGDVAIVQDDFLEWAPTPSEYFSKLRELLDRPATADRVTRAFRWYSLFVLGTTVDLTDVVPRNDFYGLPEYKTPAETATIEQVLIGGKEVCELNIERLKQSQRPESPELEAAEIKRQIRRLIHFLMTGNDSGRDARLLVSSTFVPGEPQQRAGSKTGTGRGTFDRLLQCDGDFGWYHDGNHVTGRYSPMVVRLARLFGDAVQN